MKIGLVSEFDAAHRLPGYKGKCANIHGHTYKVEAVLEGPVDASTGFVMDFFDFKKVLGKALEDLDHRYINDLLPSPTAEHIAVHISSSLKEELSGTQARLVSLKLWEGNNKWVMVDDQ